MEDHQIDNSQIQLQENIPLTDDEIKKMDTGQKEVLKIVVITLATGLFFLGIITALCVKKEDFDQLKYDDYISFAIVGLLLDYNRYKIGSKVIITYLKFSKKALEITDSEL